MPTGSCSARPVSRSTPTSVPKCICTAKWTGLEICHCLGCHQSFANGQAFDQHRSARQAKNGIPARKGGVCHDPSESGLVLNGHGYWSRKR